jgi:hypothetical protein
MVLAKVKGPDVKDENSSLGVKGISLFIVPKYRVNDDGSLGAKNDVSLVGLNHKMGYRGTTNCVLSFGDHDDCEGELLGEEGRGLATMFLMMNEARIGVGLGAAALGYAGYAQSLLYAQERRQGRPIASKEPSAQQVPIIEHPDVKRMLLAQKVNVEGALALCFYGSYLVDLAKSGLSAKGLTAEDTHVLLDVLTPIIKAWPSEWCLEANKWAIQIFGGYGYTRDYPVEQFYRDNRLNMIHEGTNGIQSLDLLTRKMRQNQSHGLDVLIQAVCQSVDEAKNIGPSNSPLWTRAEKLNTAVLLLRDTTMSLLKAGKNDPELMISNSHVYLNMAGCIVIAWKWLKMETTATKNLRNNEDSACYRSKLFMSEYYFKHELPKIYAEADLLKSLDGMNRTCPIEYF